MRYLLDGQRVSDDMLPLGEIQIRGDAQVIRPLKTGPVEMRVLWDDLN